MPRPNSGAVESRDAKRRGKLDDTPLAELSDTFKDLLLDTQGIEEVDIPYVEALGPPTPDMTTAPIVLA